MTLADGHVDRLLETLEADFDARIAQEEDAAASDLAMSLLQDVSLHDAMERTACHIQLPSGPKPVVELGDDYAAAGADGDLIVPLAKAVIATNPAGRAPQSTGMGLVQRLRCEARRGSEVEVTTAGASLRGRLARGCPDHVAVADGPTEILIALGAILSIRVLGPGG
jgi:hypothetical protein